MNVEWSLYQYTVLYYQCGIINTILNTIEIVIIWKQLKQLLFEYSETTIIQLRIIDSLINQNCRETIVQEQKDLQLMNNE